MTSATYVTATLIQRRQMLEEALSTILGQHFETRYDGGGDHCIEVPVCDDTCELVSLWGLACELEALLP